MSLISINIEDKEARRLLALTRLDDAAMRKGFGRAAMATDENVREVFRDEASPWGEAWPAHSPVTTQQRLRKGNTSSKLLLDDGVMYGSLEREVTAQSFSLSIGGEDRFPVVHQFGNPQNKAWGKGSAPIPPRPFFPIAPNGEVDLPREWLDDILDPFAELIMERL